MAGGHFGISSSKYIITKMAMEVRILLEFQAHRMIIRFEERETRVVISLLLPLPIQAVYTLSTKTIAKATYIYYKW